MQQSIDVRLETITALALGFVAALGCSAAESPAPADTTTTTGGAAGNKPSGAAGAPSASGGSAPGGALGGSGNMLAITPLPLVVDQFFATSGYMADAQNGNATMTPLTEMGDTTCEGKRSSADARGSCHIVTFSKFEAITWGGVYWQYPDKNWGEQPGLRVEAGATKIRFKARGEKGGEKVGFFAGGVGLDSMSHTPTAKNYDGFWISGDGPNTRALTTEWADYELDLTGKVYDNGVLGAFAWGVGQAGNTLPVKFYVDDIVWEK